MSPTSCLITLPRDKKLQLGIEPNLSALRADVRPVHYNNKVGQDGFKPPNKGLYTSRFLLAYRPKNPAIISVTITRREKPGNQFSLTVGIWRIELQFSAWKTDELTTIRYPHKQAVKDLNPN